MGRSLKRRAGIEVSSCAWLGVIWAEWRADPNGYYTRLGLNPARAVLMTEIDSAWRRRLLALHPDTGDGDVAELARARVAYEVLSDPDTRRQYDALGPNEVWMDELLLEEVVRIVTVGPEPVEGRDRSKAAKSDREAPGRPAEPEPARAPEPELPSTVQTYFWEDEEWAVPDDDAVAAWASEIGRALWELTGARGRVRVGFTAGPPTVEVRQWGVVYMVPSGMPADRGVARAAVLTGEKLARMDLRGRGSGLE